MKYDVHFSQPVFTLNRRQFLSFHGKGTLYVQETGLVADGQIPQVNLPFIDRIYRGVIGAPTSRSIPYSTIRHHRVQSPWLLWMAKAFVLFTFSLFLVGFTIRLVQTSDWLLLIPLLIIAALITVTLLIGRPTYRITCRDQNGHSHSLFVGFRRRADREKFSSDLTRFIEQANRAADQENELFSHNEQKAIRAKKSKAPSKDAGKHWAISGLLQAWIWCLTAILSTSILHIILNVTAGSTMARMSIFESIRDTFYHPGVQLYALFSPSPVVYGVTDSGNIMFPGTAIAALVFWTILATLIGAFFGLARLNPNLNHEKALAFAKWLPVVTGVIFIGWNLRQFVLYSMVTETDEESNSLVQPPVYYPHQPVVPGHVLYSERDQERQRARDDAQRKIAELIEQAAQLEQAKKYEDAENSLNRAIELTREQNNKRQEATILALFGQNFYRRNRHLDAQSYFEQANAVLKGVSDASHEQALVQNLTALNLDAQGKPAEAEAAFRQALSALTASREKNSINEAVIRVNFAQHFERVSAPAAARQQYDAAISIMTGPGGLSRPGEAMNCYTASAANLAALSRWGESLNHASQAIRIAKQSNLDSDRILAAARSIQIMSLMSLFALSTAVITILGIALSIAWAAGRRGYNAFLWLVVTVCSGFPMANLVVLASIPDRRIAARRGEFLSRLNQLKKAKKKTNYNSWIDPFSMGDQTTQF